MKDYDVSKHVNKLLSAIKIEDDVDRVYIRGMLDGMAIANIFFNKMGNSFSIIREGLKNKIFPEESDSHPEQTS